MKNERYDIDIIDGNNVQMKIPNGFNPMSVEGFKQIFLDNNNKKYYIKSYHICNDILVLTTYGNQILNKSKYIVFA